MAHQVVYRPHRPHALLVGQVAARHLNRQRQSLTPIDRRSRFSLELVGRLILSLRRLDKTGGDDSSRQLDHVLEARIAQLVDENV